MKFFYTTLFVVLAISSVFAQKQGNQWYFGVYAGLDFNSGTPVPILTSDLDSYEGCASIADKTTGKLLFYSDGVYVWDSTNTIMPNGGGLGGNVTTTQGAVIVPKPGSDSLYYLFTLAAQGGFTGGDSGFYFNVVDMSLHGGLGAVTTNDSELMTPSTEKCAVTLACNGTDYWVVAHQMYTDAFYAYLVTANGISAPVISHSGIVITDSSGFGAEAAGYMRISNDGSKIAFNCEYALNTMQLSDFDDATGTVSNSVADTSFPGSSGPYGLCFSPGNSKLYITYNAVTSIVYQYNIQAGNNSAIIASRISVGSGDGGAIQQGPDGRLYVVRGGTDTLSVIANPDSLGAKCNFIVDGVNLGGRDCYLGLPDIIPNYNRKGTAVEPSPTIICDGQSALLIATGAATYSWTPATGLNSTTGDSVIASPTADVTYTVTCINANGCSTTVLDTVSINQVPNTPIITRKGNVLTSSATEGNQWALNDTVIQGATNQTYTVTKVGCYSVISSNIANGCSAKSDTICITTLSGIDQLSAINDQLSIYPNPTGGEIFINISPSVAEIKDWNLFITDVLGRTVYTMSPLNLRQLAGTFEIDLSNLLNGMYFITVVNNTGRTVLPLVKQN